MMQNRSIFDLIRLARLVRMSHYQQKAQRIKSAYGNTHTRNPAITQGLVAEVANKPNHTMTYYYQGE